MPTNPYVNNYNATNEQSLVEDLIIESIQMDGMDVLFVPRNQPNIHYLYNEDAANTFGHDAGDGTFYRYEIEVYQANVDDFDGDGGMMSQFGLELDSSATFIMAKRRFKDIVGTLQDRPNEGDLFWSPITKSLLEIKHVKASSPFFQLGQHFVYEITVSLFRHSYETVETGDFNVDKFIDTEIDNVLNPETDVEDYGQNDEIDTQGPEIEFDPSNPFGVR